MDVLSGTVGRGGGGGGGQEDGGIGERKYGLVLDVDFTGALATICFRLFI